MPATIDPESFLPGIVAFISESDGSVDPAVFATSEEYFAIPVSALPDLVFADVDPASGDIRKMIYSISEALRLAFNALSVPDKPTKWVPSMSTNVQASGQILRIYSNRFETVVTGEEVANE